MIEGLNNIEWMGRDEWGKKNKNYTLGPKRCVSIVTLYINRIIVNKPDLITKKCFREKHFYLNRELYSEPMCLSRLALYQ